MYVACRVALVVPTTDGDAVLSWNYYDGVWIANADDGIVTLGPASSSTAPRWQPVPAEIIPPAA